MPEALAVLTKEPTMIRPVRTENLFERADTMFNAIAKRAYEIFDGNGHRFGHDVENWLQAEKELLHPVPLNVAETGEAFEVKAEVPGFTEKDLHINVEPRRLAISGKRETKKEEKKGKTICSETCSDEILRTVELPADVDTEKATATLKNGVLDLHLPKTAQARSIRIEPKTAG